MNENQKKEDKKEEEEETQTKATKKVMKMTPREIFKKMFKKQVDERNEKFAKFSERLNSCKASLLSSSFAYYKTSCANRIHSKTNDEMKYGCIHQPIDPEKLFRIFEKIQIRVFYVLNTTIMTRNDFTIDDFTMENLYESFTGKFKLKEQIMLITDAQGYRGSIISRRSFLNYYDLVVSSFLSNPYSCRTAIVYFHVVKVSDYVKDLSSYIEQSCLEKMISEEVPNYKDTLYNNGLYS